MVKLHKNGKKASNILPSLSFFKLLQSSRGHLDVCVGTYYLIITT